VFLSKTLSRTSCEKKDDGYLSSLRQQEQQAQQSNLSQLNSYFADSQGRTEAEQFVWDVFKQYFQADIQDFYPQLLAIQSKQSRLTTTSFQAVAGIRRAAEQPLFSEFYLQDSIQSVLANIFAAKLSHNSIVEVGNLATISRGQIRWLIVALTAYFYSAGFSHVVFTTIPTISNSFKRMGLPLHQLAEASAQQLPEPLKQQWGADYYRLQPKVYGGDIKLGFHAIEKKISTANPVLLQLWKDALYLGSQQYRMAAVA